MERAHIIRVLGLCDFNLTFTARTLGISRMTLYRRMDRYGLKRDHVRAHSILDIANV